MTNGAAASTPGTVRTRSRASRQPVTRRPSPVWKTKTWGLLPRIFSWRSRWRPVMTAITVISAMTPRKMPPTAMTVISERKRPFRREDRYRRAMYHSNCFTGAPSFRSHRGEQDDVANGRLVGQQHDETIHADPHSAGRRHAVLQRPDVVLVVRLRFLVPLLPQPNLCFEALPLVERVVELAERVGDFAAGDHELAALDQARVPSLRLHQRGQLPRKVRDEYRLLQVGFHDVLEELVHQLRPGERRLVLHPAERADGVEQRLVAHRLHVQAAVRAQCFQVRQPRERRLEVQLDALVHQAQRS